MLPPPALGRFRVILELARGGMAEVFLAAAETEAGLDTPVVVKRARSGSDDDVSSLLLEEARIAARLEHPNVVRTLEVGEADGECFIVMEYLEGQPLNRLYAPSTRGLVPDAVLYRILSDVLAGLHHAHELQDDGEPLEVVHRDVSPHNVLVTYGGAAKVVDFGVAKALGRSVETRTGIIKGKTTYMAPEQAGTMRVDRRADVFSVGVMLWEAATRRRFWGDAHDLKILQRLLVGDFEASPRAVAPEVPEFVDRVCRRALAFRPEGRYATAAEFRADVEALLRELQSAPDSEEVGRIVVSLFAEEREELRGRIRRRLDEISRRSRASA